MDTVWPDVLKKLLITRIDHSLHEQVNRAGGISPLPPLARLADYAGPRSVRHGGQNRWFEERQRPDGIGGIKGELKRAAATDRMADNVRGLNTEMLHERQAAAGLGTNADRARGQEAAAVAWPVIADQLISLRERGLSREEIKPPRSGVRREPTAAVRQLPGL